MTRWLVVVLVMLAAAESWACPVCGTAKAENDWMFGVTTLLLSFVPIVLFGGIVFFVVRAHKKAARIAPPPAE